MSILLSDAADELVHFDVSTADEAAELFVLDGHLRLVAKGRGRIRADLEPGIYKVKVRAGFQTSEELVVLTKDPFTKTYPCPEFASPAPLRGTATTDEGQIEAAQQQSRPDAVHHEAGSGSWIFVFARDWTAPTEAARPPRPDNPARGLTLRDAAGGMVVDVAEKAKVNLEGNPWAACNVRVDPGFFRLSLELASGATLEQTIVATRGWQTQVFLMQRPDGQDPDAGDRRADLAGAAILMAEGGGFQADYAGLRMAELARLGLVNGRQVLSDGVVAEILGEKFQNPMLGLFGAHLLLGRKPLEPAVAQRPEAPRPTLADHGTSEMRFPDVKDIPSPNVVPQPPRKTLDPASEEDLKSLRLIVANLRNLLCRDHPHPDVEALALALGPENGARISTVPPMLRRSWCLILDASVERPDLVPPGSLAAQVCSRVWGGEPWLLWMNPAPIRVFEYAVPILGFESARPMPEEPGLGDVESALFAQVKRLGRRRGVANLYDVGGGADATSKSPNVGREVDATLRFRRPDDAIMARLVRTFGMPRSSLEALMDKIDQQIVNKTRWCFAWYATKPAADTAERAALQKSAKWPKDSNITVSFLDGDPTVQKRVQAAALQWTVPGRTANLRLVFPPNTTETSIRISFQHPGSWSTLGTTCNRVPQGQPTMNYGWLTPETGGAELRQVVLHEFGHALGLIHEHQNPDGGIPWDREAVYEALSGPPNNWPRDVIDSNMFEPYSKSETNFTNLDKNSIMMYPIPATWTTDGFSVGLNTDLSPTDIAFIRNQYP
ncbi:MAG: hypothetical protein ACHRXM_00490 [Isosphaerales bacterium]